MKAWLLLAFIGAAFAATEFEKKCLPKAKAGFCKARLPRWWFNAASGNCEPFYYGGCGGNENRYLSEEACKKTCLPQTPIQKPLSALSNKMARPGFGGGVCSGPPVTGPCKASFLRFHYDASSNTCLPFTYGGCGGNGNNYRTERDCINACGGRGRRGPKPR